MNAEDQQFLNDLDKKLWTAANKLLPMLDAAVYKHVVLGLIFLKYVSDAFKERRAELEAAFRDPQHDYYLGDDASDLIQDELEARDYYTEKNVFWVPPLARWGLIQSHEVLKKIAFELTEKLRHSTSVDWQERESIRARLRNLVRITLRRYKYPPDKQEEAIRLVLAQAERLSDAWTR